MLTIVVVGKIVFSGLRGTPKREHREEKHCKSTKHLSEFGGPTNKKSSINSEARADISAWKIFIETFNGKSVFLKDHWQNSESLNLYTDASGNVGFAAVFGSNLISLSRTVVNEVLFSFSYEHFLMQLWF
jgi:hypothetical protein